MEIPSHLVSGPLLQAVLNYLQERPWKEVASLIAGIMECKNPHTCQSGAAVPKLVPKL